MIWHRLVLCLIIGAVSICHVKSEVPELLQDLVTVIGPGLLLNPGTLIASSSASEPSRIIPSNSDIIVFFDNKEKDGSYIFGYILYNGERRYERGVRYLGQMFVEGFYSLRKVVNSNYVYETTRYTAGKDGYHPSRVEITYYPPKMPAVDYYQRLIHKRISEQNGMESETGH